MIVPEVEPLAFHYVGNGSNLIFVYGYAITDPSELLVLMDGEPQIYPTHYGLTGLGSTIGGSVVFNYFPPDGVSITILRKQSLSQLVNLLANSSYSPLVHEAIVGRLSRVDQMLAERIGRALKFAAVSTIKDIDVEDPVANGFLRFNADADGITSSQELTLPTVVSGATLPNVFSPIEDGAVGNDVHDDTAALQALGARVQAAGGGHIVFPAGKTYKVYSTGQPLNPLFNFVGLRGVTMDFNGSQIKVYRSFVGTGLILYLTLIDGCSNVVIENVDFKQVIPVTVPGTVEGVMGIIVLRGSHDLSFQNIKLDGGVMPVHFQRTTATEGLALQSVRASLTNILSINSIYGFACADSGNDITIRNLVTSNVMRSYFVYGCNNHDVEVTSTNPQSNDVLLATAVTLAGTATNYLENIKLRYKVMGRTLGNAASYLTIGNSVNISNGVFRNIDVELDADLTGETIIAPLISFIKAGAGAQNLVFDGIRIHGGVRSIPALAGDLFNIFNSAHTPWSGETARNVELGPFNGTGSATPTFQADLGAFKGSTDVLAIRDFVFPGNSTLTNVGPTALSLQNTSFLNRRARDIDVVFTPTWVAAGGGAAIGNGTIIGWFRRTGKICTVTMSLLFGTTTNPGTGIWTLGIPVGVVSFMEDALAKQSLGIVWGFDTGVANYTGVAISASGLAPDFTIVSHGAAGQWGATAPFTWANTDGLILQVTYSVA